MGTKIISSSLVLSIIVPNHKYDYTRYGVYRQEGIRLNHLSVGQAWGKIGDFTLVMSIKFPRKSRFLTNKPRMYAISRIFTTSI